MEWGESSSLGSLVQRLQTIDVRKIATTIVNFEEQAQGWTAFVRKTGRKMSEIIDGYTKMKRQLKLYCKTLILDFDEVAAAKFQELRKSYRRLGANDLKIAAITIVNNGTLITDNVRDFRQIKDLKFEDWTTTKAAP